MARRLMAAAMKEGVSELAVMADTLDMDLGSLIDGLLHRNYNLITINARPRAGLSGISIS